MPEEVSLDRDIVVTVSLQRPVGAESIETYKVSPESVLQVPAILSWQTVATGVFIQNPFNLTAGVQCNLDLNKGSIFSIRRHKLYPNVAHWFAEVSNLCGLSFQERKR